MTPNPPNPWDDYYNVSLHNPWDMGNANNFDADDTPAIEIGRVDALDFLTAIRQNQRNTWILMFVMVLLAAGFGYVLGWGWDLATGGLMSANMQYYASGQVSWRQIIFTPSDLGVKLGLSFLAGMLAWSLIALWRADRMVLRMAEAEEVSAQAMPKLHNIVEEMSIAAGLPKPKIVVVPTDVPNAFATGLNLEKATVGVTEGLLKRLNRRQLQGVIAHEMAHILNGDMRYATLLAVMTGVLVFVAQMVMNLRHFVVYGIGSHNEEGNRRQGGHPIMFLVMLVVFLLTAILVPIIARLIQMAVSRQREYLADATAVRLTRDPQGLIGALQVIASLQEPSPKLNQALEPLFIVTPVKMLQNSNMAWFSTHPPLQNRIERLKQLE